MQKLDEVGIYTVPVSKQNTPTNISVLSLQLSAYLASPAGPIRQHTPAHLDADAYIELLLVVAGHRTQLEIEHLPDVFMPVTGEHAMRG